MLALAFAAAMLQPDPINDARRAYAECLHRYLMTSLQAELPPAAFQAALDDQCTAPATAYREALVRRDQRSGGGRERAEQDARTMIDDARANTLDLYRDHHANGTMPPR